MSDICCVHIAILMVAGIYFLYIIHQRLSELVEIMKSKEEKEEDD